MNQDPVQEDKQGEELPLFNGPSWVLDLIRLVVEAISGHPKASKREIRDVLRKKFQKKFVTKRGGSWVTIRRDILTEESQLRSHLDKTWLDQYAIPMCVHLLVLVRSKETYRLTANGEKLAAALADTFEDTVRSVIIRVDSQNWGVLRIIEQLSRPDDDQIKAELEKSGVRVRKKDHLEKYLTLLKTVGLIQEDGKGPPKTYELDKERFAHSSTFVKFKSYESVKDPEFMEALYKVYREQTKIGSPYVEIDDLRPGVSRLLNWPEEFFSKRLKEIPLRVGNLQLLFSQAAFPKVRSIERSGRYFDYLSIYVRD